MNLGVDGWGLQAAELEKEIYPVLDELTSKISTLNLEHVRRLKSHLVALTRRVQKVMMSLGDEWFLSVWLVCDFTISSQHTGSLVAKHKTFCLFWQKTCGFVDLEDTMWRYSVLWNHPWYGESKFQQTLFLEAYGNLCFFNTQELVTLDHIMTCSFKVMLLHGFVLCTGPGWDWTAHGWW